MKASEIFKFTEKCLYHYKDNLARLNVLNDDLKILRAGSDVHVQTYQLTFNFSGMPSDPVASYVEKIQSLESQIKRLERRTAPITRLIKDLASVRSSKNNFFADCRAVLELFYFQRLTLLDVAAELGKSRRTISSRREALVKKAAGYLGV